jgi:di/tricarboxylate transporter
MLCGYISASARAAHRGGVAGGRRHLRARKFDQPFADQIRRRLPRVGYGLSVIGLRRGTKPLNGSFLEEHLTAGDILLVIGSRRAIRALEAQFHDFLLLTLPAEIDQVAPAINQAPYALLSLGVMVFLMVTGIVPNVIAALIGCLMMGFFRCIDMDGAYRAISWKILLLIVGVMPFAVALERTGGVDLAVNGLLHLVGEASLHVLLASLFVLTAVIGLSSPVNAIL